MSLFHTNLFTDEFSDGIILRNANSPELPSEWNRLVKLNLGNGVYRSVSLEMVIGAIISLLFGSKGTNKESLEMGRYGNLEGSLA